MIWERMGPRMNADPLETDLSEFLDSLEYPKRGLTTYFVYGLQIAGPLPRRE